MEDIKIDLHDLKGKIVIKSKTKFKIHLKSPVISVMNKEDPPLTERQTQTISEANTRTNILYDINNGFMLANNFYDTDSTVPRINPTGWWHSEKFDGVRAIWDGMDFYTRNLSKIAAPQWFKDKMPSNIALDGEFFIKRGHFNTTSGIVRKLVPIQYEWEPMRFMVFDVPSSQESFEVRLGIIQKAVATIGLPLICIQQTRIENLNDLMSRHKLLVSRGAEGSMLRKPYSKYIPGRSESVLKVKDQSEEDAYILNWDEGNGKNKGKLGALWIKWVNPVEIREHYHLSVTPYTEFRVGSGFKDIDRCKIGDAPIKYPKNDIVKVGFFGLQDSGKPRHPAFKGIREH